MHHVSADLHIQWFDVHPCPLAYGHLTDVTLTITKLSGKLVPAGEAMPAGFEISIELTRKK